MGRPRKGEEKQADRPPWALRIAEARNLRGWNQEKMAGEIGQSQSAVSDYERGRSEPDLAVFHRIAERTGTSEAWLILGIGPREPSQGDAAAVAVAEGEKGDRHFSRALVGIARMLAEEGLDPDALTLVRMASRIARQAKGATDQLEAREIIDRAIETERREWREGLEAIVKKRV